MKRRRVLLAFPALIAGCAGTTGNPNFEQAQKSELIDANYHAAERLLANAQRPLSRDAPIIVATLVRLENLNQSSNLGRLIAEQIGSRFTQRGYGVVELKLRGTIFVRATEGEMVLSRDVREIATSHRAQAIVVGTYALAQDYVYINVKLVEAGEHRVIAAHDYLLPLAGQIRSLAASSSRS